MRCHISCAFILQYVIVAHGRLQSRNKAPLQHSVQTNSAAFGIEHFIEAAPSHSALDILVPKGNVTACGQPMWRPHSASVCPSSCPYLRPSDDKFCYFSCVTKAGCTANDLLVGFADEETHQCTACMVTGCSTCAGSNRQCGVCDAGYTLKSDGTCSSNKRYIWFCVYGVIALGALFVVVYVIALIRRPIVNEHVLVMAKTHRSYTKVRNPCSGHRMYPLTTNLTTKDIAGVGLMLHFRWQIAMLGWAVLMLLITGLPALEAAWTGWPSSNSATEVHPGDPKTFEICQTESGHLGERVARVESRYLVLTIALYLVTFFAAIVLAVRQRNFFKCEERREVTMNDYSLLVSGFPIESGDSAVEEEYLAFFREQLPGVQIVGVSVIWNIEGEAKDNLKKLIHKTIHERERILNFGASRSETPQTSIPAESEAIAEHEQAQDQRGPCCTMEFVDSLFLGCDCAPPCCGEREKKQPPTPVKLLQSLQTTGYAFLVVEGKEDMKEAHVRSKTQPLCFRQKFNLEIHKTLLTPQTTLWGGYSVGNLGFLWRMFKDLIYMIVLIGSWTLLFYYPYADYIMSNRGVRGMSQGMFLPSTLLGLLTVLGNQLVYQLCLLFAERSGFRSKDMRDCFYCGLYLLANVVNTCLDMWTVYLLAQGQSLDMIAMKGQGENSPSVGDQLGHPSIRQALYEQLFAYLWPSTMFLAFAFEPIAIGIVPYYLGVYLIRSRKDVRTHPAELCLECPPFDLSRYVDILIITMLCILMTYLATIQLWCTYAALVFSLLFVYGWDHYRLLRLTKRTEFDQDSMDQVVQWLTAIPCAMLGVAIVLRAQGATGIGLAALDVVQKRNLFFVAGTVFVGHLMLHFAVLYLLVPYLAKRDVIARQSKPYSEAASIEPCNWFTANAVHCLRSRYIYEHTPACFPYVGGKEYLMRKNPEQGLYYEEPKVIPEDGLLNDVQELQHGLLTDLDSLTQRKEDLGLSKSKQAS